MDMDHALLLSMNIIGFGCIGMACVAIIWYKLDTRH